MPSMIRTHAEPARSRGHAGSSGAGLGLPAVLGDRDGALAAPDRLPFLDRLATGDRGPAAHPAVDPPPVVQLAPAEPTDEPAADTEPLAAPSNQRKRVGPRLPVALGDAPSDLGEPVALPYRGTLERAFGRSLDGVQAFTGPEAQAAAAARGTRAFAAGPAIAFADPAPSLHLVAHEVAHTLQHRNGPARPGPVGRAGWAPLEVEADIAAHIVAAGGRAEIRGHAGDGAVQHFSATAFIDSLATAAKKAAFAEIQKLTGYDPNTGIFEADVDLGKAVYYLQPVASSLKLDWLDPVKLDKATKGSNLVHLKIDFAAKTASISAPVLRLAGVDTLQFHCGEIVLNAVDLGIADLGETIGLSVGSARVRDVRFKEYKLGYPTVRELTCAEILLPGFGVGAKDISDTHGWLLGIRFGGANIQGLVYPGLPPINVMITKGSFALDGIGSSLAPPSDSGVLATEVPAGVLPSDSRIDLMLTGLRGGVALGHDTGRGLEGAGGFDHFLARAVGADGQELASVQIDGFTGSGSQGHKAGVGHIDRVALKGAPAFVQALLAAEPVHAKAGDALAVLQSAGVGPDIGTNIVLTDLNLLGKAGPGDQTRAHARASLAVDLAVPGVGTLAVALRGFVASYGTDGARGDVGASFEKFTARLTGSPDGKTTKELAAVELSDATGYVILQDGELASGGGSIRFKTSGDLGALTGALARQLKKLPKPVLKVMPVLRQLGVRGEVAGRLALDAGKDRTGGSFAVDGDLEITIAATAADSKVALTLTGFTADGAGAVASARFRSFRARLLTRGDKEAASVFVEGVRARHVEEPKPDADKPAAAPADKAEPAGEELQIAKLVITGEGGNLGVLAGSLAKHATSLPPRVRRICGLVARNVVASNAAVTLSGVSATLAPDGKETVRADLSASVFLVGVGALSVKVQGFRQRGDVGGGPLRAGFDRLEVRLKTAKQAEVAHFVAEADMSAKTGPNGDDFAFKAKKIAAAGDPKNFAALIEGARKNLKFLPQNVQDALAVVDEFGLNGKGAVAVDGLEVTRTGGDLRARGNLTASFELAGVGKVAVTIEGFTGESTRTTRLVHFDRFEASLTGTGGAALASLAVKPAAASDKPAAGASDKPAEPEVRAEGDEANRAALVKALASRVEGLPDQVLPIVLKALASGSSASVGLTGVTAGTQDGKLVSRGQITAAADVPGVGKVRLKLVGKEASDGSTDTAELTGFKSLDLEVLDKAGAVAASLTVRNASVGADKKSFKADFLQITGDGALIRGLVADESLKLFPLEVAPKLALIEKSRLTGATASKLVVKEDAAGRIRTEAEQLTARAALHFVHGGKTYVAPDMVLVLNGARVQLDARRGLESLGARSLLGQGRFSYKTDAEAIEGDALLATGALDVRLAGGKPKATANQIKALGTITRKQTGAPRPDAPATPETKAARNDQLVAAAKLLKSASLAVYTPVKRGRYGGFWAHIDVAAGTKMRVELWVADGAITSAEVSFDPTIEFDGVDIRGVKLRIEGKRGVVATDANWFVSWLASLFVPGKIETYLGSETVPLDLKALATAATSHFLDPKAIEEKGKPDEPKLADFGTKGLDLAGTYGAAYLVIAARTDTTVAGATVPAGSSVSLEGSSRAGAPLYLTAHARKAALSLGGDTVEASKLVASLESSRDFRTLTLGKFEIEKLDLNGGAPADTDAFAKPTAAGDAKPAAAQLLEKPTAAGDAKPAAAQLLEKPTAAGDAKAVVQRAELLGDAQARDPARVRQLAARGVASADAPLPFRDILERAFNRDLSQIRVHVGGEAAAAARDIGARAFTFGDRIAFAAPPDLRLAAHEVAHALQQRARVDLPGGVGRTGDRYERHADAIADAVVAGRSAVPLVDELLAAPRGGAPQVQREDKDKGFSLDPSGGYKPPPRPFFDSGSIGVKLGAPGLHGLSTRLVEGEQTAVIDWMTAHRVDVMLAQTMPELIRRVRLEAGKQRPSLVTMSDWRILDLLQVAARRLGIRLPAADLPVAPSPAELQAAAGQGLLSKLAISVTQQDGSTRIVAFGKTPDLRGDGAQLKLDTDGLTLTSRDTAAQTTTVLQATTDMGVKFSTSLGPLSFAAGIDPNQWQISLSFGPEAPALASLPAIFANAERALGAAARGLATGDLGDPKALYDAQISPHLPAIKTALAAARAAAAVQPGKVGFALTATGPGYQPYAAEGALRGLTVTATLSVTF